MKPSRSLDYDLLTQRALREVVRMALEVAAEPEGMPEGHRFYITFSTQAPGVKMPQELIQRYPEEMTVVLKQHYWDLELAPYEFRVTLSFNEKKTRLAIPFEAVTRFYDPSVSFGLHFPPESMRPSVIAPAADEAEADAEPRSDLDSGRPDAQVLSLDAFRGRQPDA